ncbi:hypothetical protein SAMN05443633_11945 [Chryseobacterium arachidis]|uniref:Uncharacterized protein n=1 Tax=Chryseobacterium arachidis TaxID=1416778 RepID=A0A1M5LHF8_9FLAO|nr:hypothetical protein [Chryseobacterium arachidis]SHG64438.1 hypothetical protein SAMN05443633_11945 [Chryseobacterium arachidis]
MSKIKLLINEVFKQGELDSGKSKKYPLSLFLKVHLEAFNLYVDEKTFVRYYEAYVLGTGKEMAPEPDTLNKLSNYLGYSDFTEFSRTFVKKDDEVNKTTVKIAVDGDEESLTEKISKVIINITNEQYFKMPDFMKKNGLGIMEMALLICLATGSVVFSNNKKTNTLGFISGMELATEKKYMYWDGEMYIATDSTYISPEFEVVAMDEFRFKFFKRITRKDTMTVENSLGKTWYSKYYGDVEFFTADGIDPDNNRELRKSTAPMIEKYAGKNADSIQVE